MKDKSVLITGGAGFIGGALVSALREGNTVIAFDSYAREAVDTHRREFEGVEYVRGDILDLSALRSVVERCDVVIHAAGIAGIDTVGQSPVSTMRVNALGTEMVLRAASDAGSIDRVLTFSTSEVYGQFAFNVKEADGTSVGGVGVSRWTYAASKLFAEHLAFAYWTELGLPTVILRPFNVYGPGQLGEGAVKKFISQALRNDNIIISGEGNQIRAWCYVDDFVDGVIRCAESLDAVGESFNIGNARAVATIIELAQKVKIAVGSSSQIIHAPALSADVQVRVPNTDKARNLLGFEAGVDLDEGIKRTVASMGITL